MFWHNAQSHVLQKPNIVFEHKRLTTTVKYDVGGLMIWACFATTGPGHFAVTESTMNSTVDQSVIESRIPSTAAKIYIRIYKTKRIKVLKWSSQSQDLNLFGMLWRDFKRAVHKQISTKFNELKQHCEKEWPKSPLHWCGRLITSYRNW